MGFNYDNILDILFEDSDDVDNFMEEEMNNLLWYDNDPKDTNKKHKHIGGINESENDSEALKNGWKIYDNCRTSRKKHPIFKF